MNCLKNKKVLLCGGTNFLGPHLVKKLVKEGCDVTVCTRGIHPVPSDERIKAIVCDCNNEERVKQVLGGTAFDIVIDSVSYCPKEVFNVLSTVKTARYIQISSIAVYWDSVTDLDRQLYVSINEEYFNPETYAGWKLEVDNKTGYGDRKKFAECVAYQMFPQTNPITVRPAYVVDPSNPEHEQNVRIPELIDWIKRGAGIDPVNVNYLVPLTRVEEEANLLVKLAANNYKKPLNIASARHLRIKDILEHTSERLNRKVKFVERGKFVNFPSGLNLNVERLQEVDFVPSQIKDWFWDYLDNYIDFPLEKYRSWEVVKSEIDTFRG